MIYAMDSTHETRVSTGAETLICDMINECIVHRKKHGAPGVVMPSPGRSIPMTKGQISDATIEELLKAGLILERYTLSENGRAYYKRHLQKSR